MCASTGYHDTLQCGKDFRITGPFVLNKRKKITVCERNTHVFVSIRFQKTNFLPTRANLVIFLYSVLDNFSYFRGIWFLFSVNNHHDTCTRDYFKMRFDLSERIVMAVTRTSLHCFITQPCDDFSILMPSIKPLLGVTAFFQCQLQSCYLIAIYTCARCDVAFTGSMRWTSNWQ